MAVEFLTRKDIILINRQTIAIHGGNFMPPDNLLNTSAFDYLIEIVGSTVFDQPMYPELWDKAAVYMYNIICNHIFKDGNKRTGLESAIIFLRLNGYRVNHMLTNDEIYDFTIRIAVGTLSLKETQEWFGVNIIPY